MNIRPQQKEERAAYLEMSKEERELVAGSSICPDGAH
jgi:hypothetical protein